MSESPGTEVARSGRAGAPLLRSPFLWAFVLGCITITALRPLLRHVPEPPPVIGQLPQFALVRENGRPFGSGDLRGGVWVFNFFFADCPTICPALMRSVKTLQDAWKERGIDAIHLASVTVDPEHDTPARLEAYAARIGADPRRWTLLTGDDEAIRRFARDGLKLPVAPSGNGGDGPLASVAHSAKLVLVDGSGRIRGYYDADASGLDEVFNRAQHVLHEQAP